MEIWELIEQGIAADPQRLGRRHDDQPINGSEAMTDKLPDYLRQVEGRLSRLEAETKNGAAERAEIRATLAEVRTGLAGVQLELARLGGARSLMERAFWLIFGGALSWGLGMWWRS